MSSAKSRAKSKPQIVSTAKLRYLRGSAQKARLVVDQIRGKDAEVARSWLRNSDKAVARHVLKLLQSAIANTENAEDATIDVDELKVVGVWVDEGPVMKRIRPQPMGRAFPIMKRTCHVTLQLGSYPAVNS